MANAGEKQSNKIYTENFPVEAGIENSILMEIEIKKTVVSTVGVETEDKRDFTAIFARLKKSARKKSVSIF